jgi:nucleotide-binding universal stress UspA family protein
MKRVLIPLDGTRFGEKILPDARRVAGDGGILVLVEDINGSTYQSTAGTYGEKVAIEEATLYLEAMARDLNVQGVKTETHLLVLNEVPFAIDEAARLYQADIIACATHGRTMAQRLLRGGIVWRAVAHSTVPVLMRHFEPDDEPDSVLLSPRRIMVPLDGSELAEAAIPVAVHLAQEWKADLWFARVIPDLPLPDAPYRRSQMLPVDTAAERKAAQMYFDTKTKDIPVPVHTGIFVGGVIDTLTNRANDWGITDVVMATHGRTGLTRVILGSIADALVHHLSCPIILVPALAAHTHPSTASADEKVPVGLA